MGNPGSSLARSSITHSSIATSSIKSSSISSRSSINTSSSVAASSIKSSSPNSSSSIKTSSSVAISSIKSSIASSRSSIYTSSSMTISSIRSSSVNSSAVINTSSSSPADSSARQLKKSLTQTLNGVQTRIRFLEYLPETYASSNETYPLIIFTHGSDERSHNDAVTADATEYPRLLKHGPPMLINSSQDMCFTVNGKRSCFIVISPQSPQIDSWWSVDRIRAVLDYAKTNLRVDTSRIYMTGLSMGGGITWAFARSKRTNPTQFYGAELAAIVPIAGADAVSAAACNMAKEALPVWAFHGAADTTVVPERSEEFVDALNGVLVKDVQCTPNPERALLTEYASVTHDSWTRTYNPLNKFNPVTGLADASGVNIYEWMLSHTRVNASRLTHGERVLSAGTYHTLGLSTAGTVMAWGSNRGGELGIKQNDPVTKSTPFTIGLDDEIIALSAGGYQSLALNRGGRIWSFGSNEAGQRGDGSSQDYANGTPVLLNNLQHITNISSGGRHNLALTADGKVYAWGSDDNGQVGRGQAVQTQACNVTVATTAAAYRVGTPFQVPLAAKIKSISAGYCGSYALDENGEVWSWGFGDYQAANLGQGVKSVQAISTPAKISGLTSIVAIAGGEGCAYALDKFGLVWAWGVNRTGCVGDGTTAVRATPVVLSLSHVRAIGARAQGAFAITESGQLWSWGETMYGSVGDGTRVNKPALTEADRLLVPSPVLINTLTEVLAIYAGSPANHAFALLGDGSIKTWGRNKSGNLGNGKIGDADSTNSTPDDENAASPISLNF
ncbi:MAG: dienelactone hydrolase family protein [Pseudomonadota bacterium]